MPSFQLDALIDDADDGRARLCARDPPGTVAGLLLGAWEDHNEKTHGVRTVSSGQDTKADHGTTIALKKRQIQTLFARDAKADSRAGRKPMPTYAFMCERCKKSFEVVLTVADRAAAQAACPVAAERSHSRWRSLPQRPHERAENHGTIRPVF